ncbi:MAG: peptidylprolyl isomerase [Ignavibacteriota bacterium]
MRRIAIVAISAAACLALIGCSSSDEKKKAEAPAAAKNEPVPPVFHVKLDTSKGMIDVEVHRDWAPIGAPIGADHFFQLVKSGFYDDARFFRVVRGFVVQFGINGDPQDQRHVGNANLPDDPSKSTTSPAR